jgi:hypothetical protein
MKRIYDEETGRCVDWQTPVLREAEQAVHDHYLRIVAAGYSPAEAALWLCDNATMARVEDSLRRECEVAKQRRAQAKPDEG